MKTRWINALIVAAALPLFAGCEQLDNLVAKNLGTFRGATTDGRLCEVKFYKGFLPATVGSTPLYLSIKIMPSDPNGLVLMKTLGQAGDLLYGINSFRIIEGTKADPKLVAFAGEVQIAFANQLANSVQFKSGEECLNLTKR